MRRGSIALILVAGAFCLAGCTPNSPRAAGLLRKPAAAAPENDARAVSPASAATVGSADTKSLAKIRQGMSFDQVVSILGPPTAQRSQLTAQAFNPFAVRNQGQITRFYYEKVGRVVFAGPDYAGGGTAVIAVEQDPHESGRPRD